MAMWGYMLLIICFCSVRVFRAASIARKGSPLLFFAFLRMLLAALTTDSAWPFACWWRGLLVLCSKPHSTIVHGQLIPVTVVGVQHSRRAFLVRWPSLSSCKTLSLLVCPRISSWFSTLTISKSPWVFLLEGRYARLSVPARYVRDPGF